MQLTDAERRTPVALPAFLAAVPLLLEPRVRGLHARCVLQSQQVDSPLQHCLLVVHADRVGELDLDEVPEGQLIEADDEVAKLPRRTHLLVGAHRVEAQSGKDGGAGAGVGGMDLPFWPPAHAEPYPRWTFPGHDHTWAAHDVAHA